MSKLIKIAMKPGKVPNNAVSRIGGEPVGMTKATWPLYQDKPMYHVLTLTPEFIVAKLPPKVAAVAVFISSVDKNQAFLPDTKESKVVFLSKEDVARGTTSAKSVLGADLPGPIAGEGAPVMEIVSYDFNEIKEAGEDTNEKDMDADAISSAVSGYMNEQRAAKIGKLPVHGLSGEHTAWCQSPEAPDGHRVLVDFQEALVPGLNCGDGFMYVTANEDCSDGRAWWQC